MVSAWWVQIVLGNAVGAALLAAGVWIACRFLRRPAIAHALWLLVLLKLLAPPMWTVPWLPAPALNASSHVASMAPARATATAVHTDIARSWTAPSVSIIVRADHIPWGEPPTGIGSAGPKVAPIRRPALAVTAQTERAPAPPAHRMTAVFSRLFVPVLGIGWIVGSALFLLVGVARVIAFGRALRCATPAPEPLQRRAGALAARLGLRGAPGVWFVPGAVCPMLWAVGRRARVLVPRDLWGRLDAEQRDAILLHELAHWRRRDHWVRWIEWAATVLYWWHPACWLARRGLREAEEQCCDAWVVWAMPAGAFRSYAGAILEAIEFLSIRSADGTPAAAAPRAAPMLASGMGQFGHLKRRLTMLKQGDVARALTRGSAVAALALGALVLPVSPGFGQDSPKGAEVTAAATAPVATPKSADVAPSADVAAPPGDGAQQPKAEVSLETKDGPNSDVLVFTDANVAKVEGHEFAGEGAKQPGDMPADARAQLDAARKQIDELSRQLAEAKARLAVLQQAAGGVVWQKNLEIQPTGDPRARIEQLDVTTTAVNPTIKVAPGVYDGKYRTATLSADGRIMSIEEHVLDPNVRGATREQRLDQIERQLQGLLDEVKQMRQQSGDQQPQRPAAS